MPRSLRWLAIAVVLVVAFLAWDASLGAVARGWNREADRIASRVDKVQGSAKLGRDLRRLDDAIVAIGMVEHPGRENDGRSDLHRAVVEVLAAVTGEKNPEFELGGGGDKLRENLSSGVVAPGNRLARITGTVKFQATPDDAIGIIAALEQREEIEAVRKVTMNRVDSRSSRQVDVNLVLESWVEVPSSRRRRG